MELYKLIDNYFLACVKREIEELRRDPYLSLLGCVRKARAELYKRLRRDNSLLSLVDVVSDVWEERVRRVCESL